MLQIHLWLVDAECAGFKQFKHKGIASANGGFTSAALPPPASPRRKRKKMAASWEKGEEE